MKIGLLALGRPTFDVEYANAKLDAMLDQLDALGYELVGPRTLLMDAPANSAALDTLRSEAVDQVLVCQVTFTDAGFITEVVNTLDVPLMIWAPREPRVGGRLRLNAFCGLNLASHALGRNNHPFSWLYADPDEAGVADEIVDLFSGERVTRVLQGSKTTAKPLDESVLDGVRIARIGPPPDGFDTCLYNKTDIEQRFGAIVDELEVGELFDTAHAVAAEPVASLYLAATDQLDGLEDVDQQELDRSLRLKLALDSIRQQRSVDAFAIRCWPETFTEYGGAVCGPVSMMGEARVPCACEADVWGALTQIALQRLADAPVFLVDLVDVDSADNSAVVWHCGQAPLSMAAGRASATIHTNRKMPLLYEFALKPGRVTLFRLSQARGTPKALIGTAEMLDRPMSFTGTSGTLRFDVSSHTVLERVMNSGLEHHMALVYGDYSEPLNQLAASLQLPVIDLVSPR